MFFIKLHNFILQRFAEIVCNPLERKKASHCKKYVSRNKWKNSKKSQSLIYFPEKIKEVIDHEENKDEFFKALKKFILNTRLTAHTIELNMLNEWT